MKKICTECGQIEKTRANFCRRCGSGDLALYEPPRGKLRSIGSFVMYLGIWLAFQFVVVYALIIPVSVAMMLKYDISSLDLYSLYQYVLGDVYEWLYANENLISIISSVLFLAAIALIFLIRQKRRNRRGVLPEKSYFREIGFSGAPVSVCILSAVLGVTLNRAVSIIVDAIPWPDFFVRNFEESYEPVTGESTPFILVFLSVAIIAPIVEETLFRGIGCSRLGSSFPKAVTVIFTAFIFGTAHVTPIAIIYATAFGVLQAFVFLRHKSILPTMICHFTFNLTAIVMEDSWDSFMLTLALLFISAAVAVACTYFILRKKDVPEEINEAV